MSNILLPFQLLDMEQELLQLCSHWDCTLRDIPSGYLILPDNIMRWHGIFAVREDGGWRFYREQEATTWEDFLLMHCTHYLADKYGVNLYYPNIDGEWGTEISPEPQQFADFDLYVDRVVRNAEGLVKEMKKKWIYDHRKKHLR